MSAPILRAARRGLLLLGVLGVAGWAWAGNLVVTVTPAMDQVVPSQPPVEPDLQAPVAIETGNVSVTPVHQDDYSPGGEKKEEREQKSVARLQLRPVLPSAADISTAVEYETWGADGKRTQGGYRVSTILGYTRGLTEEAEIGLRIPVQRVRVGDTLNVAHLGDIEFDISRYFMAPNDAKRPGPTVVFTGKAYLPTGRLDMGIGSGEFSYGASMTCAQSCVTGAVSSLLYAGAGYTFSGQPDFVRLNDIFYCWAGAASQITDYWMIQYEGIHFNSLIGEHYTRGQVGLRYKLTPTAGLQFNLKREFQADGNAFTFSFGYSSRM